MNDSIIGRATIALLGINLPHQVELREKLSRNTVVPTIVRIGSLAIEVTEFATDYRKLDWQPMKLPLPK